MGSFKCTVHTYILLEGYEQRSPTVSNDKSNGYFYFVVM